jgi:hypothetical protein
LPPVRAVRFRSKVPIASSQKRKAPLEEASAGPRKIDSHLFSTWRTRILKTSKRVGYD